jgi:hypothetical protein
MKTKETLAQIGSAYTLNAGRVPTGKWGQFGSAWSRFSGAPARFASPNLIKFIARLSVPG